MKVTINDIAKKANVSKTTVSRYLNQNYGSMSTQTRKNLERIISELNYVPNRIASGLKSKHTKIIGCTIADITNQFSSYIFKGIHDVCYKEGYQLLIMDIGENAKDEIDAIESLLSYNVEGLIINTAGNNEEYLLKLKKERKIPIVLADRSISKKNAIDVVTSDNEYASYQMRKYLEGKNYKNIALFTYTTQGNTARKTRIKGFLKNAKGAIVVEIDKNNKEKLKEEIKKYINKNKLKKAIFCINGTILLDVLQALKDLNIDYEKEKIGICSFDDFGWAQIAGSSGVTTISQQSYECGKKCTEILLSLIKNPSKHPEYIELKTKLIERGSTK